MIFRTAYDEVPHERHPVKFDGVVDMAKQEFKKECDVNVLMARYAQFGTMPPVRSGGLYGDFSEVGDLLDSQQRVLAAQDMFAQLPAKVRDRFRNDPLELLKFVAEAKNRDEAVALGLVKASPPPEVPVVPPVVVPAVDKPVAK